MATYGPPSAHSANPFIGQEYPSSAPNLFDCLQSEDMLSHNMLLPQDECGTTVHPAYLSLDPSRSAEPSPTSSSNSSLQHQRHASSNSSTSATLGFDPTIPDDVKMRDLMLRGPTFAEFPKQDLTSTETEDDVDRQMSEIFDFDSAANSAANSTANSPGDSIATETSPAKPIAGMAMPHCEQALQRIERQIMQPHQQRRLEVRAFSHAIFDTRFESEANLRGSTRRFDLQFRRPLASNPIACLDILPPGISGSTSLFILGS
ncbi:MAG: hypothetical protein L6R39_006791 [Caloplaca ligustica]|nr:MAG: hypothetical protein L6R39_006791 [Caloplaca ligustica]